jgi:uroporphyrinogen-III decarboxylase
MTFHDICSQTVFAKGAHYALESLSKSGYDVIGLDWTMDPKMSRKITGSTVTLQGTNKVIKFKFKISKKNQI